MSLLLINGRAGIEHRPVSKSLIILLDLDAAFKEEMSLSSLYSLKLPERCFWLEDAP